MMKKLYSWTILATTGIALALTPGLVLAEATEPGLATQTVGPTVVPADSLPPGVDAQRPNTAERAAQSRETAATQKTRARRTPKAQTKTKEARGQEPQLVDVPDPVDINSD